MVASETDLREQAYIRVAVLAVGLYDYICTTPAEYRFYKSQIFQRRLSYQCTLFVLIRYISLAVVIISTVGFFSSFTSSQCRHFFLAAPVMKVFQISVSQIILGIRTHAISRQARWVGWLMLILIMVSVPMEFFSSIFHREPSQRFTAPGKMNCTSGNSAQDLIAWVYYIIAMCFDIISIGIATGYLWKYTRSTKRMSRFLRGLIYEGLGYIVVLTAVNMYNMILFRSKNDSVQTSGAALGYVVVWIMSQRLLINQRDAAEEYNKHGLTFVSVARSLDTSKDVNRALRSQFENQKVSVLPSFVESTMDGRSRAMQSFDDTASVELGVQVHVEQVVQVKFDEETLSRENYRSHRTIWDSRRLSSGGQPRFSGGIIQVSKGQGRTSSDV